MSKPSIAIINIHDLIDANDGVNEILPSTRDDIIDRCANIAASVDAKKVIIVEDSSDNNSEWPNRNRPKNLSVLMSQLEDLGFSIFKNDVSSTEKVIRDISGKFVEEGFNVFVVNSNYLPFLDLKPTEVSSIRNDFLRGNGFESMSDAYKEFGTTGYRNIVALSGMPMRGVKSNGKKFFIQQSAAEDIFRQHSLTELYSKLNDGNAFEYKNSEGEARSLSKRQCKTLLSDDAKTLIKEIIKKITLKESFGLSVNDFKDLDFNKLKLKHDELKQSKMLSPVRDLPSSFGTVDEIQVIDSAASLPSVKFINSEIFAIEPIFHRGVLKSVFIDDMKGNKILFKIDNYLSANDVCSFIKEKIESTSEVLTSDNKRLSRMLLDEGFEPFGKPYDISVGLFALSEFSVDKMSSDMDSYLNNLPEISGIKPISFDYFIKNFFMTSEADNINPKYIGTYADMISSYSLVSRRYIEKKLFTSEEIRSFYKDVEFKLTGVLAKLEKDGAFFDNKVCEEMLSKISSEMSPIVSLLKDYSKAYNVELNPLNNESVVDYLLKTIPDISSKVPKVGANKAFLTELEGLYKGRNDITLIKKAREMDTKARSIKTLQKWIDPKTGLVFPTFNHLNQVTGRLSVTEPNLQGLPKATDGNSPRSALIARTSADEEMSIMCVDYSQMDFISLANASGDEKFINDIKNGMDMHRLNASLIYDKPPSSVSPSERSSAKAVGLGVVYGMGDQKISEETGLNKKEIKAYKNRLFSYYPSLKEAQTRFKEQAIRDNAVYTINGRRLAFPNVLHWDTYARKMVEAPEKPYKAIALVGQGTSAEVIKTAMVKINELIPDSEAKMLLQVHDELIFEVPKSKVNDVAKKIKKIMESCVSLRVMPKAEVSVGPSWGEKKEMKEDNFDISAFITVDDTPKPY